MMSKKKDATVWNIPAPKILDEMLEMSVLVNGFASKSEFIRTLVRKHLENQGFRVGIGNRQQPIIIYDPKQEASPR
jgi:Arc/MetJ-type ribon-helix-helix transcriptional regulator